MTTVAKDKSNPRRRRRARFRARFRSWAGRLHLALFGVAVGLVLSGCEKHPSSIKVKGPRDAVESTKADPQFAPFEKQGDTIKLRASAFDDKGTFMGNAKNVKWDSSDRTVATVNQEGLVTILSSGKTSIEAVAMADGKELRDALPISAVIISDIRIVDPVPEPNKSLELALGEIKNFKAEVIDDRGNVIPDASIEWRSSSFAATVTPDGEVEGRAIGTTQITAETKTGKTARIDLMVEDWKKPARRR